MSYILITWVFLGKKKPIIKLQKPLQILFHSPIKNPKETLAHVPQECVQGGLYSFICYGRNWLQSKCSAKGEGYINYALNIPQQLKNRRGNPLCMDMQTIASHNSQEEEKANRGALCGVLFHKTVYFSMRTKAQVHIRYVNVNIQKKVWKNTPNR